MLAERDKGQQKTEFTNKLEEKKKKPSPRQDWLLAPEAATEKCGPYSSQVGNKLLPDVPKE